jgi:hypothetical protein
VHAPSERRATRAGVLRRSDSHFVTALPTPRLPWLCVLRPSDCSRFPVLFVREQIVLYAILSFIREIFLGQQGVLTMMAEQ